MDGTAPNGPIKAPLALAQELSPGCRATNTASDHCSPNARRPSPVPKHGARNAVTP